MNDDERAAINAIAGHNGFDAAAAIEAYPRLVEELKVVMGALSMLGYGPTNAHDNAANLLRELGEAK